MVIYLFSISLDLKCKNYTSLFLKLQSLLNFILYMTFLKNHLSTMKYE